MKAILELEMPMSCKDCRIAFLYTDVNGDDCIGCACTNEDITEFTESRHKNCPLKTDDSTGYIGYEDHIRIGNEHDAILLIEDMIAKCAIKSRPDHNAMEKGLYMIVETVNSFFRPRLEALKDAIERGIA